MNFWGKLIGGGLGYLLGGGSPIGLVIGVVLGHLFDQGFASVMGDEALGHSGVQRVQAAFFRATFTVMGRIAKADGRVTEDEIEAARRIMSELQLSPEQQDEAIRLFREGKEDAFDLDGALDEFHQHCRHRHNLVQIFIEIQLGMAMADGVIDPAEQDLLVHLCEYLGIPRAQFELLLRMVQGQQAYQQYTDSGRQYQQPQQPRVPDIREAYAVLGIDESATDKEVKKAYRRLMNQHHPDKLVSKGLPEEMMKIATEKTQEIRAAYEQVREARGMK